MESNQGEIGCNQCIIRFHTRQKCADMPKEMYYTVSNVQHRWAIKILGNQHSVQHQQPKDQQQQQQSNLSLSDEQNMDIEVEVFRFLNN